ncbi:hypothetical protein B0T14DRAFT_516344 [Immersiella caudata]|uniref:EH domain-containing protein n=1 Tax=Immersiella caudata TaxID=314043 RepID=A0AA39WXK1_9PEZI|nr:hypothetical protein B0T14DRAFT_516344 [Immersiella caudata]
MQPISNQGRASSSASSNPASSGNDGNSNSSALSAALKGATLAFQAQNQNKSPAGAADRPGPGLGPATGPGPTQIPPKPKPKSPPSTTDNGALRAATQAARECSRSRQRSPAGSSVSRQATGGSIGVAAPDYHLAPPGHQSPNPEARSSASYIAATLAASRTGSPTPGLGFATSPLSATQLHSRVQRRPSLGAGSGGGAGGQGMEGTDAEPIQPTGSLISLFEGKKGQVDVDPVKRRDPGRRREERWVMTLERERSLAEQEGEVPRSKSKPDVKPKPPPSVVVRAATFKGAEGPEGWLGAGRASPQMSPKSSVVVRGADDAQSAVDGDSFSRSEGQSKRQVKPPVASRKPKVAPQGETTTERKRETTPPPIHHARRPVTELISPEPRRIIKTPQLEPPQLPARGPVASTKTLPRRTLSQSSASSDDSFVSASSTQSPRAMSPVRHIESPSPCPNSSLPLRRSTQANISRSSPLHLNSSPGPRPEAIRRLTSPNAASPSSSSLALDSLTNAIVASNLASARLATQSSSPGPPPLPAPRRHKQRPGSPQYLQPQRTADSLQRDRTGGSSRSPGARSQQQDPKQRTGMLRTLRAPHSSLSDDEDARRRTHRTRKKTLHPLSGGKKHAHNEGSRRRWRDEVSPRERRRYEAVWASNRGLFLRPGWAYNASNPEDYGIAGEGTVEAGLVVNIVVRGIWSRSRLPADELAEVWDLVDKRGDGTLGRQEFVVGMWLIDQRLRGRKIPARVGESVWASVRGGLVVPAPKKRR